MVNKEMGGGDCSRAGSCAFCGLTSTLISKATPLIHRLQEDLGVPHISKYYLAAQISQLTLLHTSSNVHLWVLLELPSCTPLSIQVLIWLPQKLCPTKLSHLMQHSLMLWDSYDIRAPLCLPFCPFYPLLITPFPPGLDQPLVDLSGSYSCTSVDHASSTDVVCLL